MIPFERNHGAEANAIIDLLTPSLVSAVYFKCKSHQRNQTKAAQNIKLAPMADIQGFSEE
jgi:hypothetical protein